MSADPVPALLSISARLGLGDFQLDFVDQMSLTGITALFGPSGSGKSTLLRIVSGLERRARGRIAFAEEVWQDEGGGPVVPAHRRGVGYVFQEARLFPHLTVAGNLRFAERRARSVASAIEFDGVVAALDLEPLLARRPASLSGGEQQRAAIGRTLLTRPRLLLMDEPLAALDLRRKAEILPYIQRLPGVFRVPIVYVTHSIEEVARLAERMVVLSAGRRVASGSVEEVLERLDLQAETGRFEAGVVLNARVVEHLPRFRLTVLDHHGQRIVMPMAEVEVGSELRLRVRARDVSLAIRRPEDISVRNILAGRISQVVEERETAFAEILVDIGGGRLRARISRHAVSELKLAAEMPVYALVKSIAFDRRALAPPPRAPALVSPPLE